MSFSLGFAGSPAAVSAECDKRHEHESPHSIVVKKMIKALLEDAPPYTVVIVEASGHHDYNPQSSWPSGYVDVRFRLMKALPEPLLSE